MTKTDSGEITAGISGYLRLRRHLSRRNVLAPFRSSALGNLLRGLDRALLRLYSPDVRLRHEFNRWAQQGSGDRMEIAHRWLADRTIPEMSLSPDDCVLDLGCGDGWASDLLAERLGSTGRVVGLDVSDEMIQRARIKNSNDKLKFLCGSAERIPCRDELFTKVLSIEAFYYFAHQAAVLAELSRIVAPGGRLFLVICIYKGLPDWRSHARGLNVPVQVFSADDYRAMFATAGWRDMRTEELVREPDQVKSAPVHERALLITARKP